MSEVMDLVNEKNDDDRSIFFVDGTALLCQGLYC